MPSQPPRTCPRCRSIHSNKERCPASNHDARFDAVNRHNGRLSARPWRRLRDQVILEQDGLCCAPDCLSLVDEVDHILPRELRPDLIYDRDNLQGLCKTHHAEKTAREAADNG